MLLLRLYVMRGANCPTLQCRSSAMQPVQDRPACRACCTPQAPQLQALLEGASDAHLLMALDKAPEKRRKNAARLLVPDLGALRALLERIHQARLSCIACSRHNCLPAQVPTLLRLPAQAARAGDLYLLTALLRLMPAKPPCARLQHALPSTLSQAL